MGKIGDIFHGLLFGPKREAKEIFDPKMDEPDSRLYHLQTLNETVLENRALLYRYALEKYDLYAMDGKKKYVPASVANMMKDGEKSFDDCVEFLYVMQHPRNISLLFDVLPEGFQNLLKGVVRNHYLYVDDAEKIYGKPCVLLGDYVSVIQSELEGIFFLRKSWGKLQDLRPDYYIFLPSNDCRIYLPLLLGEEMAMTPMENLPEEEGLAQFSGEDSIFTALQMIESLYDGGKLVFTKLKLPAMQQRYATRMLCLPEYFADGDKTASTFNASFVINFYTLYCDNDYNKACTQWQDKLKDLLNNLCYYKAPLFRLLLPHISGVSKALVDACTLSEFSENILAVLKECADMGWMPIEKVCLRTRCVKGNAEYAATLFDSFLSDRRAVMNDYANERVALDTFFADITYPYIKAFCFMLAGFGFVEVAYDANPAEKGRSYFDGLRYVRLTALGKYALGLSERYVVKEKKAVKYFELDDSNLIAKSVVSPNPYETVLAGMAEHISKKMYKMTFESFLTDCQSQGDIVSRIGLFHDYICKEPPAVWETFFKQVKERWQPLKTPRKQYTLYQIPQGNKELQRIILSDPMIRKCSVKAEKFLLLVETKSLKTFKEALMKYGFAME